MTRTNEIQTAPTARRASNFLALAFSTFNAGDAELAFDLFVEGMEALAATHGSIHASSTCLASSLKAAIEQAVPMPGPGEYTFEYSEDEDDEDERRRKSPDKPITGGGAPAPVLLAPQPNKTAPGNDVVPVVESPKTELVAPPVQGGPAVPADQVISPGNDAAPAPADAVTAKLLASLAG